MHVETQIASYARKELKAEMLARSGIEVAKMQLLLHQQSAVDAAYDALNQDWATNEDLYVNHELGDGVFNVKITDEESKMPSQYGVPDTIGAADDFAQRRSVGWRYHHGLDSRLGRRP